MNRTAAKSPTTHSAHLLAAAALLLASAALVAQAPVLVTDFKVGDWAEESVGYPAQWVPITIAGPYQMRAYQVNVGPLTVSLSAYSNRIRHYTPTAADLAVQQESTTAKQSRPTGPNGGKFGTREPATCPNRKTPPNSATARQYFICDAEATLLPDIMNLVSDVTVEVGSPRPFNYNLDSASHGIDVRSVVYDARGKYTAYQCRLQSPALNDFANTHNCNKYAYTSALGRCFKDTFGDWHCLMTGGSGGDQLRDQMPPPGF